MNRWTKGLASPLGQDGDPAPGNTGKAFHGIDMVRDRDKLAPGLVARAENKRMRTGACLKRMGNIQPGSDFNPGFSSRIVGSGLFNDPNGNQLMLVACEADTFVWALRSGKDPFKVNLPAGETFLNLAWVRFCQAFDKILMFRHGQENLFWDGDPAQPFAVYPAPGAEKAAIPPAWAAEPFQNRILYYYPFHPTVPWRDVILMSSPSVYSDYQAVFGNFRINSGESDSFVRVWSYWRNSIVGFKRHTIHLLQDFSLDDIPVEPAPAAPVYPNKAVQRQVTREIGLAAKDCLVADGADLLFLSEPGGIYRLSEVIQEQITTPSVPVSEPIQPLIDRINWPACGRYSPYTTGACAAKMKDYAFFAVPTYAGTPNGNNVVLVYNRTTRQWESAPDWWEDHTFRIWAMHVTDFAGVETVFGLDYLNKKIYAMYKAVPDDVNDGQWHIHDLVETRGYNLGDATSFKRFQRAALVLSTVDPTITVTAISDGFNEEKNLTPEPITKDRLQFYPHAHPKFISGVSEPDEPMREDYSSGELNAAVQDFEGMPLGYTLRLPATAGQLEDAPAQECLERVQVRTNARWLSLRIENATGRCDLRAVGVEAIQSNMEVRTAA